MFAEGHWLEQRIVDELGDMVTDRQRELVYGPQFLGHIDGLIFGRLLEVKSMSKERFSAVKRKGCKEAELAIWAQCQLYMHGTETTQCLLICVEKDSQTPHYELIDYDRKAAEHYLHLGNYVATTKEAPRKINNNPSFYICKMCDVREPCHAIGAS